MLPGSVCSGILTGPYVLQYPWPAPMTLEASRGPHVLLDERTPLPSHGGVHPSTMRPPGTEGQRRTTWSGMWYLLPSRYTYGLGAKYSTTATISILLILVVYYNGADAVMVSSRHKSLHYSVLYKVQGISSLPGSHGCFKLDIRLLIRTHSNITVFWCLGS